ncbi:diglucosylglycerate octanoyltransferase [Nocardia sp. FBN12]|uniref:diglucosylglycerate octanoyltransferase n=1 Tax=Nocardia sp. FBN12 TaxID=3419766 RepID=UPI003D07F6EB
MSNEEPVRSVPDEMFQQVTAKAGRQLPDALFGPPPARPARAEREEPIRSVPDELFQQVTARSTRSLPDALFGPVPPPAAPEPELVSSTADAVESGSATADSASSADGDSVADGDATDSAVTSVGDDVASEADEKQVDTVEPAADTAEVVSESGSSVDDPAVVAESFAVATESIDPAAPQVLRQGTTDPVVADAEVAPSVDDSETLSAGEAAAADSANDAGAQVEPSAVGLDAGSADALLAPSSAAHTDLVADVSANPEAPQGESVAEAAAGSVLVEEAVSPRPVESAAPRPVLLVIADSLAYYGPKGGLPADDPRIWPNMVAAELDWDVELIARIGWTCRDAYWALIGDPRVWAAVPRAGAVVFAVGGMDTLPSPLPTALREMIRYIRPPRLRRGVRASYNWLQPKLSKLGRPVALPPRVSVDYLEQSRTALNHLRPELPVVAVLPSVHKCDAYGRVHRGRARAVKALQAWSGRTSVPLVDLGEAVRDDIESGSANPDGIHWGWAGHAAVATAMTKALQEVR